MAAEANLPELVGLQADERLLSEDLGQLPGSVGEPEPVPDSPARRRLVAAGATMTGVTLVLGIVLVVWSAIQILSSGFGWGSTGMLALGALLAGTHWGWVHVAEATATGLDGRRDHALRERRRVWLSGLEPHVRWEVSTAADDHGTITITTTRYRPVRCTEQTFTFVKELEATETHHAEEPAAAVAERAELIRRDRAADTERERRGYRAALEAYEHAHLQDADEQERRAVLRAASEALSEQINTNLREPPLLE